ncbi:MAG: hypothetical protein IT203_10205 [Fimbriimonadaceae bacterium]|nr:hypothetical protein [Fimbriimonadaceae bacterium]
MFKNRLVLLMSFVAGIAAFGLPTGGGETSVNYSYKSPDTSGGPCTVTDPGSPTP